MQPIVTPDGRTLAVHEGDRAGGSWLAGRIPGVDVRIGPFDGHLTLVERRMREVNEWLPSHG